MKIKYDAEGDILYFILKDNAPVDAVEEPGGIIISYGEDGNPVSIEFLNASRKGLIRKGEVNLTFHAA
jgi:uncharacterized protein YuzE